MKRKCPHCDARYDTSKGESSVWCEKNPRRGRGGKRLKHRVVKIPCLLVR
jgi:hypothetical protein